MPYYRLILILLLFVSACTQEPARIVLYPTNSAAHNTTPSKNPYRDIVEKGDTLYSIARKNNVEIRDVIELNRLRAPYTLLPGQTLKLPKAMFHIVSSNDNLYAISRSYGVDIGRLAKKNGIPAPYSVKKGQKLYLPAKSIAKSDSEEPETATVYNFNTEEKSYKSTSVDSQELKPLAYNEKKARVKEIFKEEEKPVIAIKSKQKKSLPTPIFRPEDNVKISSAEKIVVSKSSLTKLDSRGLVKPTTKPGRSNVSHKKLTFAWPVSGKVISRFGPKKGGLYNDGINIKAKEGLKVKAAESGEIVYAGNELRGYGNMLLIKHDDRYLTAYAHLDNILVKKGDTIEKGQKIAEVGQTGHVSSPQLHFSIRHGRKAVNPERYLP